MSKSNQTAAEVIEHEEPTDESAAGKQVAELQSGREMQTIVASTPLEMLGQLVAQGADIGTITKMMDLAERHEANQARKAFAAAMSKFRAEPVVIEKDQSVGYKHKSGGGSTGYRHASLSNAVDTAREAMSKHGLSHRWQTKQDNGEVTVTCIVMHKMGHSEETTLTAMPDTSGSKNSIQAIGSTVSYLERYTFMAATGLAAKGMDNDGADAGDPDSYERISEDQVKKIKALLKDTDTDQAKFLEWCEVDSLKDIPTFNFDPSVDLLQRKKKLKEKQAESA